MNLPYEQPPAWAGDYCYYFYFLAAIQLIVGGYGIATIFRKSLVVTAVLSLNLLITVLVTMMIFWMCRSSLANQR
jgi:drug/metabolite transporter superfamily protein YnfA